MARVFRARRSAKPVAAKPRSIIAQVDGSGTACTDTASRKIPSFVPPVRLLNVSVADGPVAVNVLLKICHPRFELSPPVCVTESSNPSIETEAEAERTFGLNRLCE